MGLTDILLIILIAILIILLVFFFIFIMKNNNNDDYKDMRIGLNKDLINFSNKISDDLNRLTDSTTNKIIKLEDKLNIDNF